MPGGGDVLHKLRIARQIAAKDFFQRQQGADAFLVAAAGDQSLNLVASGSRISIA
jgi:hypothetical protein